MFSFAKDQHRFKCLLGAGAIAMLASPACANQIQATYHLAAGATGSPIAIPATNTPVSVTCTQNEVGFRGVGQATILRTAAAPQFLEWVGMDIATNTVTSNFGNTKGTHIIYCDYTGKTVDMQVSGAGTIQIVNTSSNTASGVINFVW
jgi:hypothetical protein